MRRIRELDANEKEKLEMLLSTLLLSTTGLQLKRKITNAIAEMEVSLDDIRYWLAHRKWPLPEEVKDEKVDFEIETEIKTKKLMALKILRLMIAIFVGVVIGSIIYLTTHDSQEKKSQTTIMVPSEKQIPIEEGKKL